MTRVLLDDLMLNCAVNYAIGRQTYMPSAVADEVRRAWPELSLRCRYCLIRDVRRKVQDDDRSRRLGHTDWHPLGADCDRETWVSLLEWMEAQPE